MATVGSILPRGSELIGQPGTAEDMTFTWRRSGVEMAGGSRAVQPTPTLRAEYASERWFQEQPVQTSTT
jgi:hypothetical protein